MFLHYKNINNNILQYYYFFIKIFNVTNLNISQIKEQRENPNSKEEIIQNIIKAKDKDFAVMKEKCDGCVSSINNSEHTTELHM